MYERNRLYGSTGKRLYGIRVYGSKEIGEGITHGV